MKVLEFSSGQAKVLEDDETFIHHPSDVQLLVLGEDKANDQSEDVQDNADYVFTQVNVLDDVGNEHGNEPGAEN